MSKSRDPEIVVVDEAAVLGLVERAREHLPAADHELLKGLMETLFTLVRLVRQGRSALARLRRLVGFISSEKTTAVCGKKKEGSGTGSGSASGTDAPGGAAPDQADPSAAADEPDESASTEASEPEPAGSSEDQVPAGEGTEGAFKGHGRNPASAYPGACQIEVLHESLLPGQRCPLCGRGTLFALKDPARFLRIVGQSPLVGICWNCQRLRCSGCGAVFTARAPDEAQGPKHSETAAAMLALLRYGGGMPHHRLDHLQRHLLAPVPASTQWEVVSDNVGGPEAACRDLCRLAAQASVLHNDDTNARVLSLMGKRRDELLRRGELPDPERTGLYTTAIVAIIDEGRSIAVYFTGRKHAGENLNELLHQRAAGLPSPTLMCDALDRNQPADHEVVLSHCASHARRHVIDEVDNFPTQCRHVLEMLGKVFNTDQHCRTMRLSDDERLHLHQRESGPVMDELKAWMQAQFDQRLVEPNSGLGDAFNYMLKRWDKFTLFLRLPGAPLHNNIAERVLKKAIRHRNNSLFYRTARGAHVGDVYMSLIHTTELAGGNPFHYLTELMRHEKAVAADPTAWLPWNYQDTLARLHQDAPRSQVEMPRPSAPSAPTPRRTFVVRPPAPSAPPPAPP